MRSSLTITLLLGLATSAALAAPQQPEPDTSAAPSTNAWSNCALCPITEVEPTCTPACTGETECVITTRTCMTCATATCAARVSSSSLSPNPLTVDLGTKVVDSESGKRATVDGDKPAEGTPKPSKPAKSGAPAKVEAESVNGASAKESVAVANSATSAWSVAAVVAASAYLAVSL
ncbi:hypothetical protein H9P43_003341 [Blastocladiella emersonii ATCC 22665]|nr:hypothetical protein H9P43_003341 [Blastocladiella emersonii ATCC 22665]